jgi:hypothetical protein
MIDTLIARVPITHRFNILIGLLGLVLLAGGYYLGVDHTTRYVTKTVRVEKTWGKPTQSVSGAAVNANFAGLTCDIYETRQTVVCHP